MNPTDQLTSALRLLARRETTGEVRLASVTASQKRAAPSAWERLTAAPPTEVIALTENEEGATRLYFMVGKDTLADSETWVLG